MMTTAETNVSSFNLETLWSIIVAIIGIVGTFVTIFFAIKKFSLKIGNDFETSYIDAFSNEYIEFSKFRVKLGYAIRAIKLPKKFDRTSTVDLWYKPANGFRRIMKKDDYDEKLGKINKKIRIKDKEFLKSKEIELFRTRMVKKLTSDEMSEFEKNIKVVTSDKSIRFENLNNEEIHNFSFNMPESVTYEDASFYFDNQDVLEVKASLRADGNPNEHVSDPIMKITIKKIPAADNHNNPGIISIPLPDSTPS